MANFTRKHWLICLVLAIGTLAVYSPLLRYGFIDYDDPDYILSNPHGRGRLKWDGVTWASSNQDEYNWHPVKWASHMVDSQLFVMNPAAHHLVNVLFHI